MRGFNSPPTNGKLHMKMKSITVYLSLLMTACLLPGHAATPASSKYSVKDFVKHATYGTVKISPTGEYLAITVDHGDQDVLTVMRTSDLKIIKVNQLPDKKSVGSFHWVSPDRLIRSEEKTSELQSLMHISYAV